MNWFYPNYYTVENSELEYDTKLGVKQSIPKPTNVTPSMSKYNANKLTLNQPPHR